MVYDTYHDASALHTRRFGVDYVMMASFLYTHETSGIAF